MAFPNGHVRLPVVLLLVVAAVAGTAAALSLTSLQSERLDLFDLGVEGTPFTIAAHGIDVESRDRIILTLDIRNDGSSPAAGDADVKLLDSAGDALANGNQATGNVPPNGEVTLVYEFEREDLALDFDRVFITLEATS